MLGILKSMAAHAAAAAPEAEHAEDAAHAAGGLPQLDSSHYASQLFWLAIAFGLLYILLAKVFLPKIAAVLGERSGKIAGDLNAASSLRTQAEDAGKAVDNALADARARAHAIIAKQREAVTADIDAETRRAEAALDSRLAEADAAIASRKGEALAKVSEVATDAAQALVQKLIGVTPDQAEVQRALAAASQERGA